MIVFTFEQLWMEYEAVVNGIAYEFGGKGRAWGADTDDFRQECIAWMLDNEKKLSAKREDLGDPDQFERWLSRCLRNEMNDFMIDIRDAAGGQPRRGAYFYSTNELKALLPSMFDPEKWHEPPRSDGGGGRGRGVPSEGGNWIATLADVARAYEQIPAEDRSLLRNIHQVGMRNKDLADIHEVTEATMSYRHTRALKRLQDKLGGPRPSPMRRDQDYPTDPWRGRHAVSNAQARAITASSYEE